MTANPLKEFIETDRKPSKVTEAMLREAAERYNQLNWVRESGRPYFVGRRANGDGTFTHYLDRG